MSHYFNHILEQNIMKYCKNLLSFASFYSMDGFRVIKLSEVVRHVDMVITCTGNCGPFTKYC